MKKLSILLLALALAAFAVPAMAGDVSMSGEYTFGGELNDADDVTAFGTTEKGEKVGTFYDELDLDIEVSNDDVLFHWDVEIVDDGDFDRADGGDSEAEGTWANIVDTMWVKWTVDDALAVKFGDYGIGWGNDLVVDDAGGGTGTVGVMYSLEMVDLAFYLSRDDEAGKDDDTTMGITLEGEIGPAEVGLIYLSSTNDADIATSEVKNDHSLIGVYGNFNAGPVGVALELGTVSADDELLLVDDGGVQLSVADLDMMDGGQIILAEFALEELVGFGLNVGVVQTNEEYVGSGYGDDFDRAKIYESEFPDAMMVFAGAEYGVNDALTVGLDAILMNDGDDIDLPTEIDVWGAYTFSDNVSVEFGYAMLTANDLEDLDLTAADDAAIADAFGISDYLSDRTLAWFEFVLGI